MEYVPGSWGAFNVQVAFPLANCPAAISAFLSKISLVIAHALAHVLAGPGPPTTLLDAPGDSGEAAAHATARRFRDFV